MNKNEVAVTAAAGIVLSGVQGIAPLLPAMQGAYDVTDAHISLVVLTYVLAATLIAFPVSALGDRFGERPVLVLALATYGACGLAIFWIDSFRTLLMVRTVQGCAFGVVLALTISAVSRSADPVKLARTQRIRMIAMAGCEVALPITTSAILGSAGWRWAYAVQGLALPIAGLAWAWVNREVRPRSQSGQSIGAAISAIKTPFGAAVQVPGFVRFFIKFTVLTYFPLLATQSFSLSPMQVGVVMGASAAAATATAAATPGLLRRWTPGFVTALGGVLCAAPICLAPWSPNAVWLVAAMLMVGVGDGLLGVMNNVVAGLAAPSQARAAFLGVTGSIRNLGKLSAPATVGVLASALPLTAAFSVVGAVGLLALAAVPAISRGIRAGE